MLNELSRLRSQPEGLTAKESSLTQENDDLKLKMSELEKLNMRLTQELETLTKKLSDSEEAWKREIEQLKENHEVEMAKYISEKDKLKAN